MENTTYEIGTCEECGVEINLSDSWRVDEKFLCQNCFEQKDI